LSLTNGIVVIGAGLAGAKAVEAVRDHGFTGAVTLVGAESNLPYERPPLSKSYLAGRSTFDDAVVHPAQWYEEHGVDLRLGMRATAIDPATHTVTLAWKHARLPQAAPGDGRHSSASAGARRRCSRRVVSTDSRGLGQIRDTFGVGRRLVIIGAGWIGLEVAAAARGAGTDVTIIEMAELPLLGVLGPKLAHVFADLHRDNGVDLRLSAKLDEITVADRRAVGVRLADGTTIPAAAVVVGVGVAPDIALAERAGLALDNGVLVDASLRTSDPDIYAVGDIANHDHPTLGVRVPVEHWAAALNQPATAAEAMLGEHSTYTALPYFFSDQYDVGMEYLGYAPPGSYARIVVRGDLAVREFVAFWLDKADRVKTAMHVNVWDVLDLIKPLIVDGTVVDPDRLADPGVAYPDVPAR
jgi:3-phenylpropionate/trans-cinnamate dioxygenase ferredoxin reductase component